MAVFSPAWGAEQRAGSSIPMNLENWMQVLIFQAQIIEESGFEP